MSRPPHAPWFNGPPRFNVGLAPIAREHWLIPDTEAHVLPDKRARLARPETCYRAADWARAAEHEAARRILDHTGGALNDASPLLSAAARVSDDLVVIARGRNGAWRAGALVLCAPTFFSIDRAFDDSLTGLHGPVPGGARLANRIGRIFDNLADGLVLERFNWTLQAGDQRFVPDAAPMRARADAAPAEQAKDTLHVRVERQTITRLPETGAVVFTIRICLDPVSALDDEDRAGIARAWRGASGEGRAYKGWDRLDRLAEAWFSQP